ncbi:MAG: glycoside hydrolase family 38 N-terminal domain-containing protein [Eubacteriales bacterium]
MSVNYCIISHTHWDREWYAPLENFKLRLNDLIDNLFVILEKDEGYRFHLDAQTIVLEDYLLARPSKKQLLEKYIKEGRILAGPWYVQNDFYLTSGEATVRNLIIGRKIAEDFGANMPIGYAADQFGLISQLPQILVRFGYDNCIFGRGYAFGDARPLEFYWRSKEGSTVLCEHMAYWYNNAQRFSENNEESLNILSNMRRHMSPRVMTSNYLLMNGVDHLEAQENLTPIITAMQPCLENGDKVFQDTFPEFINRVKVEIAEKNISLETYTGEMRNGGSGNVLTGTLSSRVYLKQWNSYCQALLEKKLEPIYSFLSILGIKEFPAEYSTYLWKLLIENHPHDSICGCSVDAVHDHMVDRFKRVDEAGTDLVDRATDLLGNYTDRTGLADDEYIITAVNSTQADYNGPLDAVIEIPVEENTENIAITDANKNSIPFIVTNKRIKDKRILSPINLPGGKTVREFSVTLGSGVIQGMSHRSFIVSPADGKAETTSSAICSANKLENEFIAVKINKNGTIDLTDKKTGNLYSNMLLLEDTFDHGDSYLYSRKEGTAVLTSVHSDASAEIVTENKYVSARRIKYTLDLTRENHAEMPVSVLLTLKSGVPYLFIAITVTNTEKNHRLRVQMPTEIETEVNHAGSPYDCVTRKKVSVFPNDETHPNTDYLCVEDKIRGIAFFQKGLYEYENFTDEKNTIAFSLLRSTGRISGSLEAEPKMDENWLTPGNQCIGEYTFEFAVYPYSGDFVSSGVPELAQQYLALPFTKTQPVDRKKFVGGRPFVQGTGLPGLYYRDLEHPEITVPRDMRYFALTESVNGALIISAFKGSESGSSQIFRLYNVTDKAVDYSIEFVKPITEAYFTTLGEDHISPIKTNVNSLDHLTAKPKEIITIEVK